MKRAKKGAGYMALDKLSIYSWPWFLHLFSFIVRTLRSCMQSASVMTDKESVCCAVISCFSRVRLFATPWAVAHQAICPWNSPGKNTGVGCHALLQGIFPTQGCNPGFLHCRQILYCVSYQGSPRILEWVNYPFSRRSS